MKKKRNRKIGIAVIISALFIGVVAVGWASLYFGWFGLAPFGAGAGEDEATFKLTSYVDGEDVSDFVEISVWVPKDSYDDNWEVEDDIFTLSNFEEEASSVDAEDVSEDLTSYDYVWIEIDPDAESVFANNFHLLTNPTNILYEIDVYHQSSDVNFNILTSTLDEITVGALQPNDNYTVLMDVPHQTLTNLHVGTNWDIEQTEYDEMTQAEQEDVQDEKNYRCQAPTYDPAVDLEKEYDSSLERYTNCFALEIDFNTSVSTTDGAITQVNTTISTDYPIELAISGDKIYMIFYETIDFESGAYSFQFEMVSATWIEIDNVKSGRIVVPREDDNLGAFTAYSTIAA